MKYILFLLTIFSVPFLSESQAMGFQVFRGFLTKRNSNYYFTSVNTDSFYQTHALNRNVEDNLKRFENGDFIIGSGVLDVVNKKINIESVDYVGLRRLLGSWRGTDGIMVFKDFSTMSFTPQLSDINENKIGNNITNYQKEFRYSMSPSDGNEWALFVSDDKGTSFATMEITKKSVIMKIYESESGKIVRTLTLGRL
ncbi:MAG: hypothetical protein ACXVB1_14400 [Pseudobdellovibrionaceae bacterium]